jgi:hypothetical protein
VGILSPHGRTRESTLNDKLTPRAQRERTCLGTSICTQEPPFVPRNPHLEPNHGLEHGSKLKWGKASQLANILHSYLDSPMEMKTF